MSDDLLDAWPQVHTNAAAQARPAAPYYVQGQVGEQGRVPPQTEADYRRRLAAAKKEGKSKKDCVVQ